ncbi:MAG: hypothetical protein HFG20_05600 [Anaerotruncus sp.]|jgi:hypothetical protein|nr:hypothetical protein [Anaerotruncus sp.]
MLTIQQKERVTELLRADEHQQLAFACRQYIDNAEPFTDFCCEHTYGNEKYLDLIESICASDPQTRCFVWVYGLEEAEDEDAFIFADTLIVSTSLGIEWIERSCKQTGEKHGCYLSPSHIRRIAKEETKQISYIEQDGTLSPLWEHLAPKFCRHSYVYTLWWD